MQIRPRRVAILRGGSSSRHEQSVQEGAEILSHMFENLYPKWQPHDIFVDKMGVWHLRGQVITPSDLYHQIDLVWNTADPSISNTLQSLDIPVIGTNPFLHALKESRELLRSHIKRTSVCLPRHLALPAYEKEFDGEQEVYAAKKAHEIFRRLPPPYIVRSLGSGSDMGIHTASSFEDLALAIYDGANHAAPLLVEELVGGKECTVHTVRNFRGQEVYQMTPKSLIGEPDSLRLSFEEKEKIKAAIEDLHAHFENPHYARFDLILTPKGLVYLKDFSLNPDFKENSHLENATTDFGIKTNHILEHILESALK